MPVSNTAPMVGRRSTTRIDARSFLLDIAGQDFIPDLTDLPVVNDDPADILPGESFIEYATRVEEDLFWSAAEVNGYPVWGDVFNPEDLQWGFSVRTR